MPYVIYSGVPRAESPSGDDWLAQYAPAPRLTAEDDAAEAPEG